MLRIPVDKICIIIEMARESLGRDMADGDAVPMGGESLPSGEDYDDAGFDALFDYVDALNGDELADLLALQWLGQGDATPEGWISAQAEADDEVRDGDAVSEIIRNPTLPDDLIAGLEALGYDCPEV